MGLFGKKKAIQPTGGEMAEEGLRQVAIAVKRRAIKVERGRVFNDIYVHADYPAGAPRITYIQFSPTSDQEVIARCVILLDRTHGDIPVWQIDWAVQTPYRGKGIGKSIATKALGEFINGMKGKLQSGFAIEAVVDEGNDASRAIARSLLGGEETIYDKNTGRKVHSFLKRFSV